VSEAAVAHHKARLLELAVMEREGRLLDAEKVKRFLFDLHAGERAILESVPSRLAAMLPAENAAKNELRVAWEAEIHRVLTDLSAAYKRLAAVTELRPEGGHVGRGLAN
jgi:hypothetical protein